MRCERAGILHLAGRRGEPPWSPACCPARATKGRRRVQRALCVNGREGPDKKLPLFCGGSASSTKWKAAQHVQAFAADLGRLHSHNRLVFLHRRHRSHGGSAIAKLFILGNSGGKCCMSLFCHKQCYCVASINARKRQRIADGVPAPGRTEKSSQRRTARQRGSHPVWARRRRGVRALRDIRMRMLRAQKRKK